MEDVLLFVSVAWDSFLQKIQRVNVHPVFWSVLDYLAHPKQSERIPCLMENLHQLLKGPSQSPDKHLMITTTGGPCVPTFYMT